MFRVVNKLRNKIKDLTTKRLSREELHNYWQNPPPSENQPLRYLIPEERSIFLLELVEKHLVDSNSSILEIGCNVGRNLNVLHKKYKNLAAIEISQKALNTGAENYPSLFRECKFYNSSIEDQLVIFKEKGVIFDLIFSMAVLQHIHDQSIDQVLNLISSITKLVILVEDENCISERHFPRNYQELFEKRGFAQVEEIKQTTKHGLSSNFITRIFKKEET